jgi:uncharacterized protein YukE
MRKEAHGMQDLIELTPELLLEQSQEMASLCSAYENLFANVSSDLNGINGSWSDLLSNNFSVKIGSAQKLFSGALTMLRNSAESLRMVAESSEETDVGWASKIGGALGFLSSTETVTSSTGNDITAHERTDIGNYCQRLSEVGQAGHAEYALLCQIFQKIESENGIYSDSVLRSMFKNQLNEYLSPNDPLYNISVEQLQVTRMKSGLAAMTIRDGENAIVIFAGTDFSKLTDVATDVNILMGSASVQSIQAHQLIADLSQECSNIVVTGHSLGGYLATATALENDAVSECIAFDPPGRLDGLLQNALNHERASRVSTYKAKGSPVSCDALGHKSIGKTETVDVDSDGNWHRHGIKQICDALGGKKEIHEIWDNA